MIFDAHTHLSRFGPTPGSLDRDEVNYMLARMARCGIDKALLLGPVMAAGYDPSPDAIEQCNEHTVAAVSAAPERFAGLCYLNAAHDAKLIEDNVERFIANGPLQGIKLWVAVNARDARMDVVMEHAIRLDCPVLIHAWYKTDGPVHNESDPSDVAELARRHPQSRIIMAHLNGCGVRGVLDVADCPNVMIDTSGAQPTAGILDYALNLLGPHRILYGSDWPVRDFAPQLAKLDLPTITPDAYRMITGGNLRRVLMQEAVSQC